MLRRRLIWQLYSVFLAVTLPALVAVTWYYSSALRSFYYEQTRSELGSLAHFAAEQVSTMLDTAQTDELDRLCKRLGGTNDVLMRTRVTVILPSGKVIGDSDEDPAVMKSHSDRPEIVDALEKGFGWSLRPSPTLGIKMMYVAVPVRKQDKPAAAGKAVAVVRISVAATAIDRALGDIHTKILWGGFAVAACAAALSLAISSRISRPLVNMEQIAQRFAQGQLDLRVPIPAPSELAALANALNEMARQLHDKITTITSQRNELEAVLSSMIEGVVAVDHGGHIVSINRAAAELLSVDPVQVQGRNIEEAVRQADIHQFVRTTLESKEPTEAEVSLQIEGERFFQLHGARVPNVVGGRAQGASVGAGAVIVLHDITRMRRLENVRRDFVANVSHELKTPTTSIQGFVEALLEKGVDDPEQTRRYIGIIAKHSDRLNSIIEDLLSLSRLEEDQEQRRILFENASLRPALAAAIELLGPRAEQKQIGVKLICADDIEARVNPALIEQAVFNLVDNAIKYSQPGEAVTVSAERTDTEIAVSVQDNGCGIDRRHLSRLFERFYVVDKGRSRKLGGTGLGLAIVKHIAQVHGGSVTVESTLGKGSTFTIHLPITPPDEL
jgi:two-component system phosphate regulon sensor histidine kinase PhoR